MSLATNITNLATRVATEIKAVRTLVNGNQSNLNGLTTTAKTNLVAAINELKSAIDAAAGGAAGINDGTTASGSTWSSTKISTEISAAVAALVNGSTAALDTINELATAIANDPNFAATMTTALGNRVRFDAAQTLTGPQQAQALANIGAAAASHTHNAATGAAAGFMSASDKSKLDGIAAGANAYTHPTGDGSSHVPATGTTNGGKFLKAGGTANSAAWAAIAISDVGGLQSTLDAKAAAADVGDTNANFVTTFEAGLA